MNTVLENIKDFFSHVKFFFNIKKESRDDFIANYLSNKGVIDQLKELNKNNPDYQNLQKVKLYLSNDFAYDSLVSACNNNFNRACSIARDMGASTSELRLNGVRHNNSIGQLNNFYAGIGASKDMSNYDSRTTPQYTFQEMWTTFYQTSAIAKQLIDVLTDWYASDWVDIKINEKSSDQEEKKLKIVEECIEEHDIDQIFIVAIRQMFMHGGCALFIDTDDPDWSEPLNMTKGKRFSFRLVDKSLMYPAGFINVYDISQKSFNHPSHWRMIFQGSHQSAPVHESRFIFFVPEELPFYARINQLWWGTSALIPVRQYINIVDRGFHSAGNQLQQASMAFLKNSIRDKAVNPRTFPTGSNYFGDLKNANFQAALTQNGNANCLDKDDSIERLEIGNLTDQMVSCEKIINYVCVAHGIPPSVYYGSSSGGNHASDPEIMNWYNKVGLGKKRYCKRPLKQMLEVISLSKFGDKDTIGFSFINPNKPSKLQAADIGLKNAQKYVIMKKAGFPNKQIVQQIIRDGDYEDMTLEDLNEVVSKMDSFDTLMLSQNSMEGKDMKDDKNKSKNPTDSIIGSSPEAIVSDAIK